MKKFLLSIIEVLEVIDRKFRQGITAEEEKTAESLYGKLTATVNEDGNRRPVHITVVALTCLLVAVLRAYAAKMP